MFDYKRIIKSQSTRSRILKYLEFIPDNLMIKMQYRIKLHRKVDLKNPTRWTEKIQWYKLFYRNPIMHECVDKYQVREYVLSKGLGDILVELYNHVDSLSEIEWEKLPNSFIIKMTNGGGGNDVVLCKDKTTLDITDLPNHFRISKRKKTSGREWAYYGLTPSFIVEELLVNNTNPEAGINDYKFFCYNGIPRFVVVDVDRFIDHKRNIYDINWKNLNISSDHSTTEMEIMPPENYERMIEIA